MDGVRLVHVVVGRRQTPRVSVCVGIDMYSLVLTGITLHHMGGHSIRAQREVIHRRPNTPWDSSSY